MAEAIAARNASEIDALTGIANRRVFEDGLRKPPATRATARWRWSICDHFKLINDQFGHATGDVVLQSIAPLPLPAFRVKRCGSAARSLPSSSPRTIGSASSNCCAKQSRIRPSGTGRLQISHNVTVQHRQRWN